MNGTGTGARLNENFLAYIDTKGHIGIYYKVGLGTKSQKSLMYWEFSKNHKKNDYKLKIPNLIIKF